MKPLLISTDKNILEEGSAVRARMIFYGEAVDELSILLVSYNGPTFEIAPNVTVYTRSRLGSFFFGPPHGTTIISAQDPFENGAIGYVLSKRFNIPLQFQIHTDFLDSVFRKESLKNKIRVFISSFLLPRADSIRVVSKRIKESLKGISCPVYILPAFVDQEEYVNAQIRTDLHKKYPQFEKIILMASRLTVEKNIESAIRAMDVITKEYNAGLVIVGEGPLERKLQLLAKGKNYIVFEPWTKDLPSYYKTADVFLNTSNYEGYGRTLVEATLAGTPVVSTDVGVAEEVGAYITTGMSDDIAREVVKSFSAGSSSYKPLSREEYTQKYRESLEI